MNQQNFSTQMNRLVEVWPTSFHNEKVKLIWEKVCDLSDYWMSKTIEHFLSNNRTAPLPNDFIELARVERNIKHSNVYFPRHESQIHPSENSIFLKSDILEMFNTTRDFFIGKITSEALKKYCDVLERATDFKIKCKECDDSGVIFFRTPNSCGTSVKKCFCSEGQKRKENY